MSPFFCTIKKDTYICSPKRDGEMAEWSIAAVLKTVDLRGSRGSNPCLSAISGVNQVVTRFTPIFTPKKKGLSEVGKISSITKLEYADNPKDEE